MKRVVEKCSECPFADKDPEWSDMTCSLTPDEEIKKSTDERGVKSVTYPEMDYDQIVPPHWCPLRRENIEIELSDVLR